MPAPVDEPPLVTRFRELYRHVLQLREAVEGAGRTSSIEETARDLSAPSSEPHESHEPYESHGSHGTMPGSDEGRSDLGEPRQTGSTVDVDSVRFELLAVLESQGWDSPGESGAYRQVTDEARYAMAALADEVFLNADWEGRRPWKGHLLEAHLFESRSAGEVIFERIDDLIAHPDPARNDLASIYLMLLGLGFQGKYRDRAGSQSTLAAYGRRLFVFLAHRRPELQETTHHLFPEAYERFPGGRTGPRLPHLRPWILALALLLALWLAVGHGIWNRLSARVGDIVNGARTTSYPAGAGEGG